MRVQAAAAGRSLCGRLAAGTCFHPEAPRRPPQPRPPDTAATPHRITAREQARAAVTPSLAARASGGRCIDGLSRRVRSPINIEKSIVVSNANMPATPARLLEQCGSIREKKLQPPPSPSRLPLPKNRKRPSLSLAALGQQNLRPDPGSRVSCRVSNSGCALTVVSTPPRPPRTRPQ